MTENEDIKKILYMGVDRSGVENEHSKIEQALQELMKYRAIGSVEECREAVEKMKPKKVIIKPWSPAECPTCGKSLSTNEGDGYYRHWTHIERCPNVECAQRLLWEE